MTVYFTTQIEDRYVEPMPIKIGRSSGFKRRKVELRTGNPLTLVLMGGIRTQDVSEDRQIESALHKQFQRSRIRGEWFAINPADAIDRMKTHSMSAFIAVGSDPFEIISYDSDAIPEYACLWEWGDVTVNEFCPVCGWAGGWSYNENYGGECCMKCGAAEHDYEAHSGRDRGGL